MQSVIQIECPPEILIGLHLDAEGFSDLMKRRTAIQPVLMELDGGEKQTIALAIARRADLVIIDERLGRRLAQYVGLKVTGTLGVLAKAKSVGLIPSFRAAADALRYEGIFYSAALIARLCDHLGE